MLNLGQKELEILAQKFFELSFKYDWVSIASIASFYSLLSDKKLHKVLEEDREYQQLRALHCISLGNQKQLKIKCVNSLRSLFLKFNLNLCLI